MYFYIANFAACKTAATKSQPVGTSETTVLSSTET